MARSNRFPTFKPLNPTVSKVRSAFRLRRDFFRRKTEYSGRLANKFDFTDIEMIVGLCHVQQMDEQLLSCVRGHDP